MSSPFEYVDCKMSKEDFVIFLKFLTVDTLKDECSSRGISVSGNKDDLINRLLEHDYIYYDEDNENHTEKNNNYFIEYGKKLGANFLITYGKESTLGFYKEDGTNYRRLIYSKINSEGVRDKNNDIKIGYRANLDECGNAYNKLYKGYWYIAPGDFAWGNQEYKSDEYYYKLNSLNDDYEVPLKGWDSNIEIIKIIDDTI